MEDEAEISQPPDIHKERNSQIPNTLRKARYHQMRSPSPVTKNPYIYNERAYEPNVISIGPYHHGHERLQRMEATKLSCFLNIFNKDNSVADKLVRTIERLEAQVRQCYEEPSDLESDEFVEMVVYDGCFIVHLIYGDDFDQKDIFKEKGIVSEIMADLLLLENQLPFFVLLELNHILTERNARQFARRTVSLFNKTFSFHLFYYGILDKEYFMHLLELVHSCYHPSFLGLKQHREFQAREPTYQRPMKFIGSATELDDVGIGFFGDTIQDMKHLKQEIQTGFDILFTKDTKVLMIPTLRVDDMIECRLRNYIAYEQFIPSGEPTYFTDFVLLMDNLINTSKDVQLLRNSGIIENWLGDDEAVAQMFNKLHHSVFMGKYFYYAEVFGRVNEHRQKRWNRWKTALKKNHFNTPWLFIPFLAATVLLLLTIVQTIFSLLSYCSKKN
ncbi:hypothetical protein V6N13_090313 [Hibiscus sabdariffa]